MKKEWEEYAVDKSLRDNQFSNECVCMPHIYHYTHLESAYSSLHEGKLISRLVYDKSKLNKRRITVCWLSPNDWTNAGGYRYGNVGFRFETSSIVDNRHYYWIEPISYKIPALHILVTKKDYDNIFDRYHPSKDNGPWWYDPKTGEHFYNSKYCLELLVEDDIDLTRCDGVEIKNHSNNWCSLNRDKPESCCDYDLSAMKASPLFLSRVVATGLNAGTLSWIETKDRKIIPNDDLLNAYSHLLVQTKSKIDFKGTVQAKDSQSKVLIRTALLSFSYKNKSDAKSIISLFESEIEYELSLRQFIANCFNLTDTQSLEDKW